MLDSMTAVQFSEWAAYERKIGMFGSEWKSEILSQIHELLQHNNQLTARAYTKKKIAGKFREVIRPWKMFSPDEKPEAVDDDEE